MNNDILYSAEEPDAIDANSGKASRWCTEFPKYGLLLSLECSNEKEWDKPVLAEIILHRENDQPVSLCVEGRFQSPTRGLTGEKIPNLLFLLIPEDVGITAAELRASRIDVRTIRKLGKPSRFDDFKVRY